MVRKNAPRSVARLVRTVGYLKSRLAKLATGPKAGVRLTLYALDMKLELHNIHLPIQQ